MAVQIKVKEDSKDKRIARAKEELVAALGTKNVSDNMAVRCTYRGEVSHSVQLSPLPDIVVRPKTVEHVQALMRIATRHQVPLVPVTYGSVTMHCFPWTGGIVVDMMGMDKILKIDTGSAFALVEPGVTFNQLIPEIKKVGFHIPFGSYPAPNSVYGSLAGARTFDHALSARYPDQCLALEVVLPDASVVRTGSAAQGGGHWHEGVARSLPNLKGLFSPSQGTLGIVTKAAVRIWPRGETQVLPMAVFDSIAQSFNFGRALAMHGVCDQTMIHSWLLVLGLDCMMKGDISSYMTARLTRAIEEVPPGMFYNYVWSAISGFKEQVEGNLKVVHRLAKEYGGKIIPQDEFSAQFPGLWKLWSHGYIEHEITSDYVKAFHDGVIKSSIFFGGIDDLIRLEPAFLNKVRHDYYVKNLFYYTRFYDQGRSGHLRFMYTSDGQDAEQVEETHKRNAELRKWVNRNFPDLQEDYPEEESPYSIKPLVSKLHQALDPNGIMNPAARGVTQTIY